MASLLLGKCEHHHQHTVIGVRFEPILDRLAMRALVVRTADLDNGVNGILIRVRIAIPATIRQDILLKVLRPHLIAHTHIMAIHHTSAGVCIWAHDQTMAEVSTILQSAGSSIVDGGGDGGLIPHIVGTTLVVFPYLIGGMASGPTGRGASITAFHIVGIKRVEGGWRTVIRRRVLRHDEFHTDKKEHNQKGQKSFHILYLYENAKIQFNNE